MLTLDDLKKIESKGVITLTIFPSTDFDLIAVKKKLEVTPSEWDKIKRELKKCDFEYKREDDEWYCDLVNGEWKPSFR